MDKLKLNPIVVRMNESEKGVVYRSIVAMGMRARQVNDQIRAQISERMADIVIDTSETDVTNYDQIAISREFDNIPKPTFFAMKEILEGKLHFSTEEPEEIKIDNPKFYVTAKPED